MTILRNEASDLKSKELSGSKNNHLNILLLKTGKRILLWLHGYLNVWEHLHDLLPLRNLCKYESQARDTAVMLTVSKQIIHCWLAALSYQDNHQPCFVKLLPFGRHRRRYRLLHFPRKHPRVPSAGNGTQKNSGFKQH